MPSIKFNLISLGCAKNLVDSEELIGNLHANGFRIVADPEEAELAVVNTCAFLKEARTEAKEVIDGLVKMKNKKTSRLKKVAVLGCLVQYTGENGLEKSLPGVDLAVPLHQYPRLPELLRDLFPYPGSDFSFPASDKRGNAGKSVYRRFLSGSTSSVYLKIAEGCNNRCSYCLIPYLRGKLQSKSLEDIMQEAHALLKMGAREINLVAQDTTAYGIDLYGRSRLGDLLQKLGQEMKGRGWIRLLYTHPSRITRELLEIIAREPAVCNYIDMPIQHASSKVLRRMGRNVTREDLSQIYGMIRDMLPSAALRTTVMVGFPEEGEKEFEELLEFLQHHPFERLGAFSYSPEKGTPAYNFPQRVSPDVSGSRLDKIMSMQKKTSRSFNRSLLGSRVEVLVDSIDVNKHKLYGRLYSQAPEVDGKVVVKSSEPASTGDFIYAKITGVGDYDLVGEKITYEPGQ